MESFNPIDMFKHMSWLDKSVVMLLLIMSVYSLWVMIDRFAVFSRAKRYSLSFVLALRDRMAKVVEKGWQGSWSAPTLIMTYLAVFMSFMYIAAYYVRLGSRAVNVPVSIVLSAAKLTVPPARAWIWVAAA